jgi:hypothetical protein
MKKVVASIILFVFLFNIMGYYISFDIMLSSVREGIHEVIERMDKTDKNVIKLSFSMEINTAQPCWTINNKEFILNDEMYDVIRTIKSKDKITYVCLHDNDETELRKGFDNFTKNNLDGNKENYKSMKKEIEKYVQLESLIPQKIIVLNAYHFFSMHFYEDHFQTVTLPPPKAA